jgi:DNA-binding HxlR family transcriptional regulator
MANQELKYLSGTNKKVSMRKETSTNALNKRHLDNSCGMAYFISVLGGRWKLSILGFLIDNEKMRYSDLRKKLRGISERMLIAQLRELEADGLLTRSVYPEVPPRVEYSLSEKGKSLKRALTEISEWGERNKTSEG